MLDRIGLGQNLVEWRPSRKASNRRRQSGSENQDRINVFTTRFRNALKKSVEGIIEAGRVLIEAKNELEHGAFISWVVCDLRFGTRGHREPDLRKAEMLMLGMKSYQSRVIGTTFRPSPCTLWEECPNQRLVDYKRPTLISN